MYVGLLDKRKREIKTKGYKRLSIERCNFRVVGLKLGELSFQLANSVSFGPFRGRCKVAGLGFWQRKMGGKPLIVKHFNGGVVRKVKRGDWVSSPPGSWTFDWKYKP